MNTFELLKQKQINNHASYIAQSVNENNLVVQDRECSIYVKDAIRRLNGSPYSKYRYNYYNSYYLDSIQCVIYAEKNKTI